jgi:hypothetical protein
MNAVDLPPFLMSKRNSSGWFDIVVRPETAIFPIETNDRSLCTKK